MVAVVTAVTVAATTFAVADIAIAVAEVGVALSVAGAVTHDKTLTEVGGVMSLAGGLTSVAADAGMFDAATGEVGSQLAGPPSSLANIAPDTPVIPDASTSVSASPTTDVNVGPDTSSANTTFDNAANNASTATNGGLSTDTTNGPSSLTQAPAGSSPTTTTSTPGADGILNSSANPNVGVPNATSTFGSIQAPGTQLLNQGLQQSGDNGNALASWWNSLSGSSKAAVVQGVGGALGGLSSAYTAQQKLALEQLINSQSYQKYQQAYANANSPSTITYTPAATPAGNLISGQQSGGLINSATKPAV